MNKNVSFANLQKWSVNWKDVSDIAICRHELIHSEFFIHTVYGSYQSLISKLIKQHSDDNPDYRNQLLILNYELYKQSVYAHEVVATYCSIKQLDVELIENYLCTLSTEYMNYYNTLSKLIDPYFKSTYMQYLVGHRLVSLCFDSYIRNDIESCLGSYNCYIDKTNSPNYRLNEILSNINENDLKNLDNSLKLFLDKEIVKFIKEFDYQKEEDWKEINLQNQNTLNKLFGDHIYDYLRELLENRNVIKCSYIEEEQEGFLEVINNLDKNLSVKILSEYDFEKLKIAGLEQSDYDVIGNMHINNSQINNHAKYRFNENVVTPEKIPVFEHGHWPVLNELSVIHTDKIYDPDKKDDVWFAVKTRNSDYQTSACCINKKMYMDILNNNVNTHIFDNNEINTNIIGIHASCFNDTFESIEKRILESINSIFLGDQYYVISKNNRQKNQQRHLESKMKNVLWYMHGDFIAWINFLLSTKKVKCMTVQFNDNNATNLDLLVSKKLKNSIFFGAVVFYSDYLPGTFIRYFNVSSYQLAYLRILELINSKRLIVEDHSKSTRRFHEKKVIRAFKVIESVWEFY
ncbi:hypothetical protein [Paenibacillus pedocola]|uniref:hypothetical protein n=1 Tax=Paenibacillus pedocola TaxID=3242193 RepID=UPI00287809E6|nr:hypothetical protein [Paenibacillus typhae]